jgi:hypothetical protein
VEAEVLLLSDTENGIEVENEIEAVNLLAGIEAKTKVGIVVKSEVNLLEIDHLHQQEVLLHQELINLLIHQHLLMTNLLNNNNPLNQLQQLLLLLKLLICLHQNNLPLLHMFKLKMLLHPASKYPI